MLNQFATKEALLSAFSRQANEPDTILAEMKAVYRPHHYCGGWMIPGFGYSTERIGVYVVAARAGTPR